MLDAVLERITYANEETGYTIARVATDRGSRKALAIAVRTAGTGRRHTGLTHRLGNPDTSRP